MPERASRAFMLAAIFAAASVSSIEAAKIDWDALEKKAQQYTGQSSSGGKSGDQGSEGSVNLSLPSTPTGRFIDTSPKLLSEQDTRHITVHMKLANRHFMKKNYTKAIDELELVFERQADHGGGRFMRAVIAARKGDYMTAWQNILVAREKDPDSAKIKSFIEKLSTKMPQPEKFVGVPGIYRPTPVSVGEKSCDIIERFLKEPVSQNLVSFSTEEFQGSDNNATFLIKMKFSNPPESQSILNVFKNASGNAAERTDDGKDGKSLDAKIIIDGLPLKNPEVKTLSSYVEFVKNTAEETDIAISDSIEKDKENKVLEVTYEIAARDFASLNTFLRKVSPYSHYLRVIEMKLAFITGSEQVIWKGKIKVEYQL
jgi:hypothetical protein